MTTNRKQKVISSQNFQNTHKIENLPDAVSPQEPTTLNQSNAALALKQDNVSGGSGVLVTGSEISLDLATSGTDYNSLTLSGTGHSSLDGEYTLAGFKGSLTYSGTDLDLDEGGNYNVYYKSNGGGVWAMLAKRDTDNIHNNGSVGESNGHWIATLTNVDLSTVTSDYNSIIPNYQAVDSDFVTSSSEQDENGNGTPSSADSQIIYGTGSTPAGLKFDNSKLAVDFAESVSEAASTKVFPSSIIKSYVEEQRDFAKTASNNSFSNAVANLVGNPSNVQSALESAATEINSANSAISSSSVLAATEYAKIVVLESEMDAAEAATAQEIVDREADIVLVENSLGFSAGSGVVSSGENVTSGATVKEAISELDVALDLVQGDLSSRLPAVDYFHAGTEYALTAAQVAGTEAFDNAKYDVVDPSTGIVAYTVDTDLSGSSIDVNILVSYGAAGDVDAGVFTRNSSTGYLTRASYFDESSEIQKNAIMQVKYGGPIAGAQFYVSTPDEPVIGSSVIGFELASAVIVGESTIDEPKLVDALANKINAKSDKHVETVTTDASGYVTVTHALGADVICQCWLAGEVVPTAEFSGATETTVVLGADVSTDYKVVIIG
tara:strand:+ start:1093 stop:2916 length:1824 start_codon:yes stop_codon:yes gene_type:complete